MGLAFVPVYLRILGIEAYGLIGFFLSMQTFFAILDMGLSATLNREIARQRHSGTDPGEQRNLVRTFEWIYWPVGLFIAVAVFALSGVLAEHWLQPVALTTEQSAHALALLGLSAGLQWPTGFYAGGFRGLERQVLLNGLNAAFATLRYAGAAAFLILVSPTLEAFLWWQVGTSALQVIVTGILLWRLLPAAATPARFHLSKLLELKGFALGLAGISAVAFVLTQADRILLSTLLPLDEFGFYTLAATIAAALSTVVQPFFAALYPRYCGLVAVGDWVKLVTLYHQSNHVLAAVLGATAAVLAFFAYDVIFLWTGDRHIASNTAQLLSLLAVGWAINGLMHLPYALQLAIGATRIALYQNLVAVSLVVPAIWWFGSLYGGVGTAAVWVALNLAYLLIGIPIMHRFILPAEMRAWYWKDVLPPVTVAIVVAAVLRWLVPSVPDGFSGAMAIAGIGFVTLAASTISSSRVRTMLYSTIVSANLRAA